jgi:hypothetical protein
MSGLTAKRKGRAMTRRAVVARQRAVTAMPTVAVRMLPHFEWRK